MNDALPTSLVGVPDTVIAYEPLGTDPTVKDPETVRLVMVHVGFEMNPLRDEDIVQAVSLAAKLDPETAAFVPGGP